MGCGGSTSAERRGSDRRSSFYQRLRRGSIKIGNNVAVHGMTDSFPQLIFVFGGPGTKKGKVMNELMSMFGLSLINVENVIMDALISKLDPDEPKNTASVSQLVKARPELLRLDWTMKQLAAKLETLEKKQCYLVDFMPNLKFLLSASTFIKECEHEFKFFESNFPISCAIYLSLPVDKVMKKKQECTSYVKEGAEKPKENEQKKPVQSDEASTHRTKSRATTFANCIQPFLQYFEGRERLITMDVSTCGFEAIMDHISEFFISKEFIAQRNTNAVVLFAFSEEEVPLLKTKGFNVVHLDLEELKSGPGDTPEQLIQTVCRKIDNSFPTDIAFVVHTQGTSLTKDYSSESKTKQLLFKDNEDVVLTDFAPISMPSTKKNETLLKGVSTNHEVCLFHRDVPFQLCHWIATAMTANRNSD